MPSMTRRGSRRRTSTCMRMRGTIRSRWLIRVGNDPLGAALGASIGGSVFGWVGGTLGAGGGLLTGPGAIVASPGGAVAGFAGGATFGALVGGAIGDAIGNWINLQAQANTPDQDAVIQIGKEAKQLGGVTEDEAKIIKEWATETGVPFRGPESHPNRPVGRFPHIHVGPIGHIPVKCQ